MNVTYEDIINGYTLQAGDTLNIHGCKYEVCRDYFLSSLGCCNDKVFMVLGIDKIQTCRKYGMERNGMFPYMKSFECLTNLVKALYEMSPFKVGDKVRVKPMTGDADDYPFFYADEMAFRAGEIHTITSIEPVTFICKKKYYNGDPHRYRLDLDGEDYCYDWHSSMFELVARAEQWGDIGAYEEPPYPDDEDEDKDRKPMPYTPGIGYSRKTTKTHITL